MTSITALEIVLYSVNFTVLELFPVCHRHPVVFIFSFNIEFLIQFNTHFFSLMFLCSSDIYLCQGPWSKPVPSLCTEHLMICPKNEQNLCDVHLMNILLFWKLVLNWHIALLPWKRSSSIALTKVFLHFDTVRIFDLCDFSIICAIYKQKSKEPFFCKLCCHWPCVTECWKLVSRTPIFAFQNPQSQQWKKKEI